MSLDTVRLEDDPFIISLRAEVMTLEDEKDRLCKLAVENPKNIGAQLAYEAAVMVWARSRNKCDAAIKAVLGL